MVTAKNLLGFELYTKEDLTNFVSIVSLRTIKGAFINGDNFLMIETDDVTNNAHLLLFSPRHVDITSYEADIIVDLHIDWDLLESIAKLVQEQAAIQTTVTDYKPILNDDQIYMSLDGSLHITQEQLAYTKPQKMCALHGACLYNTRKNKDDDDDDLY